MRSQEAPELWIAVTNCCLNHLIFFQDLKWIELNLIRFDWIQLNFDWIAVPNSSPLCDLRFKDLNQSL